MKTKYLFGMLLGSGMLAACSAEDDFNSTKVTQDVNPSAPIFSVNLDNNGQLLTRAVLQEGNVPAGQWQVKLEGGDLLSLFHGVEPEDGEEEDVAKWTYEDFKDYDNAIYEGNSEGEDGFNLTTRAMVKQGAAVMIYPADTTFKWVDRAKTGAPTITIDDKQTAKTKEKTPYMSEFLTIAPYTNDINKPEAGYGRKYDVTLKRVASTLTLQMAVDKSELSLPEGITPIEVTKVELSTGNVPAFTHSINVIMSEKVPVARDDENKLHTSWAFQSELDVENTTPDLSAISTTDVKDNVATFTLLPVGETAPNITEGSVVVYTTYGKATLTGDGDVWHKGNTAMKVLDGLKGILTNDVLWAPTGNTASTFYSAGGSENTGGHLTRSLDVKLKDIDMDGLHIKDEPQLIDVAKVLKVIGVKDKSTGNNIFYLDGEIDENTGKNTRKFQIYTADGYNALKEIIGTENLELQLCKENDEEQCDLVILHSIGTMEVPEALKFGKASGDQRKINVELAGDWTLTNGHTYSNVDSLVVTGNLELIGTVNAKNPNVSEASTKPYVTTTSLVNKGTISVEGDVILQMNTVNYGIINVGSETSDHTKQIRLRMSGKDLEGKDTNGEVTLINEVMMSEIDYTKQIDDKVGRGQIYLWKRLATVDDTKASVINYGYIEIKQNSDETMGSVLLYANGTEEADFSQPFKNENAAGGHEDDNIFGVLKVIATNNPLSTIQNDKAMGFVKYATSTIADMKNNGLINYIEASGLNNKELSSTNKPTYLQFMDTSATVVNIKNGTSSTAAEKVELTGLIVPANVTVSVPTYSELKVTTVFLKGEIYRAGKFTCTDFESYVGGEAGDYLNVSSAGGSN